LEEEDRRKEGNARRREEGKGREAFVPVVTPSK
jgi:hypothetical protein